jgi:hypothetical protein
MESELEALQLLPDETGDTEIQCAFSCGHTCGAGSTCGATG